MENRLGKSKLAKAKSSGQTIAGTDCRSIGYAFLWWLVLFRESSRVVFVSDGVQHIQYQRIPGSLTSIPLSAIFNASGLGATEKAVGR